MVNARDILTIQRTWKNPGDITCGKYAAALITMDGEIIIQEPKSLLAQDEIKIKEHSKRVKKALGAEVGNGIISQGFIIQQFWFLDNLVDNGLKDTKALGALLQHIADNTMDKKNPIEVLIYHCTYDIPGKKENGEEIEDSEYVYKHIVVLVCDTKMQKKELAVIKEQDDITIPNRIVKNAITGFVFPSFENMRPVDDEIIIYNADTLYPNHSIFENMEVKTYRTTDEIMRDFEGLFDKVLGVGKEKDTVLMSVVEALGDKNPYDKIGSEELKEIFESIGVEFVNMSVFLAKYQDKVGRFFPTANQLIIPRYAAMRAANLRRERKKKLLLRAAAAVKDAELARELQEEADR